MKALLEATVLAGVEPNDAQMEAITALTAEMEGIDAHIEASGAKFVQPPRTRH